PFRDKKDVLKAAASLFNTMRYYEDANTGRILKDIFAKSIVIPLLPDPNLPKDWPDQHMLDITRRILCGIDNGRYYYDQRSAIAAVASVAIVCEPYPCAEYRLVGWVRR